MNLHMDKPPLDCAHISDDIYCEETAHDRVVIVIIRNHFNKVWESFQHIELTKEQVEIIYKRHCKNANNTDKRN